MIQRSQTLFLLGVLLLAALMFSGNLAKFVSDQGELALKYSGLYGPDGKNQAVATWPLTVYFSVYSFLVLLAILSYKNRVRQMRIVIFLILLSAGMAGMLFYYTWFVKTALETTRTYYLWRFVVPPIAIILLYLAFRGIRRDELLVKAFDRIR